MHDVIDGENVGSYPPVFDIQRFFYHHFGTLLLNIAMEGEGSPIVLNLLASVVFAEHSGRKSVSEVERRL